MWQKALYKIGKFSYCNKMAKTEKQFYTNNLENFFRGQKVTVILSSEARSKRRDVEENVVDFFEQKSMMKPCIAWLLEDKANVAVLTLDKNCQGKLYPEKISYKEFCNNYEFADNSEITDCRLSC